MRQIDIAIIGGGLAGSTAAAMLGRAGLSAVLIDPHEVYPPDFRCEKLDGCQVQLLRKTGLDQAVFAAAVLNKEICVMRSRGVVERRACEQYGILYDTLVNTMREQISPGIEFVRAKATAISTSAVRQLVTLSTGETVDARLIVLSNGLNIGLRQSLGIARETISTCHSISIGFDIEPAVGSQFEFPALTYFPEHASDRMAYLALFPVQSGMRTNLFVYRDMHDLWLRQLRNAPKETLVSALPALRQLLGDFSVPGDVRVRPVDLYRTTGHRQPGVVLLGDAFATSCPAAGTGVNKVLTDVERLCNVHIPHWLASPGMGVEKIAGFYEDPVKVACDAASLSKAFYLRALSTDSGLSWRVRRWARSFARSGIGAWRRAVAPRPPGRQRLAAS